MRLITRSAIGRTLLLAQFSAAPWKLSPQLTLDEMRSYATSPSFDELLRQLAYGEEQKGAPQFDQNSARDRMGAARSRLPAQPGEGRDGIISRRKAALVQEVWSFPAMGCTARNRCADSCDDRLTRGSRWNATARLRPIMEVEAGGGVALAMPMLKRVAGKRLLYRSLTAKLVLMKATWHGLR